MLPHFTTVAGQAVSTIVEILAVHAADAAVKVPLAICGGKLGELLFVLLELCADLTRRDAVLVRRLGIGGDRCEVVWILRDGASFFGLQASELFLMENALDLALLDALLASETTRFVALDSLSVL